MACRQSQPSFIFRTSCLSADPNEVFECQQANQSRWWDVIGLFDRAPVEKLLEEILAAAWLTTAQVTRVSRPLAEQARIMHENCVQHGAVYNKQMYAVAGGKVVYRIWMRR
jgi:hypothetical protein